MELTERDKKIFEYLFYNAELSTHKLAKLLSMKQPSVHERIKKLESQEFISRYDALPKIESLPFFSKIYYVNLDEKSLEIINKSKNCFSLQELFGEFKHQIVCLFRTKEEIKKFEKLLPKRRVSDIILESNILYGSLFDFKLKIEKQSEQEKSTKLDKIDFKLLNKLLFGGARKTIVELANNLNTSCSVIKYRKEKLKKGKYILSFSAQPGSAFKSIKISYHVFKLDKKISLKNLENFPRCVLAYLGGKTLTVVQLSLSLDDYLFNSEKLIRKLEPYTKDLKTFFIDKPIVLNRLKEDLFNA